MSIRSYFRNFDESSKDSVWFSQILWQLYTNKRWLISQAQWNINESYATGNYDVEFAKKKYDWFSTKPDDQWIDFTPLDILGSRINAITSIIEKQGYEIKARCTDPAAKSKKQNDIDLMKAEKALEPLRQQLGNAIGTGKPLPIANENDYSSDVSPVKKMGLDISNPIDEGIYRDYLQRQIWEIALELGIAHYFKLSGDIEILKQWVRDMVNNNCFAGQVMTNSFSGEPFVEKLYPFNVYQLLGTRPDGKDAIGKGWEKIVSVRDIIALMGTSINKDQLDKLLSEANTYNTTNYAGVWFPNRTQPNELIPPEGYCTWNTFINMTVSLGYLELKSQNSDLYLHTVRNGNFYTEKLADINYVPQKGQTAVSNIDEIGDESDVNLEYKFYDVTYKAFYLPFTQLVFGFGKLPLAVRYGTKNSLTDFSIITYQQPGQSMNRKCQPYIRHIFDLWCKFQHFINESRPSGEGFDLDVIREMAHELIGTDGKTGDVTATLKILQNTTNTVYKRATGPGGVPVGGDGDPIKPRIRGIDPTVADIARYMTFDFQQITEITGVSSILLAQATPDKDQGLGVSKLYLQQSLNTIHYINSAIQNAFSSAGLDLAQKIQAIVNGSASVEAYKSLEDAIGEKNIAAIKELGKMSPPYQYSVFLEYGINPIEEGRLQQMIDGMILSKSITAAQAMSVTEIRNFKLAAGLLTYLESKATNNQQQQALALQQLQMQAEQQKSQAKLAEIDLEGKYKVQVADTTGKYAVQVELIKVGAKDQLESKKQLGKVVTSDIDHQRQLQKMQLENNLEQQNQESAQS